MMAVLIALGGAAAACGLIGSLWSLHEMKRGRMRATGRHLLVSLVCWPLMLGLSLLAAATWFSIFKGRPFNVSQEIAKVLLGYALVAIAAPVLVARLIWTLVGADPTASPNRLRGGVKSAIACVLVTGAIITAKFIVEREAAYYSYKAQIIQIAGEISHPEEEDLAKVRAAVEQALGESHSGFRHAVYGSRDPSSPWKRPRLATPYIVLEATSPDFESFHERIAEIAERLRAILPKRLEVNAGADGVSTAWSSEAPAALWDGYRHTRPLNAILLLVPLAVVLLVATTTQALPWLPLVLALISAAACGRSSWPGDPKELPPSIVGLQPLPPLATPEYDFSTTRDAMESLIKAAKRKDVEGFQRGISGPVLQQALSQARDPGELMKLIATWSYSRQVSRDGNTARVRINSTNPADQHINWPMMRENGDWKLADPLGAFTSAASGTAVIAIGADGIVTVDGKASPPEKLGERIAALAKRRPASVIIRAAETIPYNRVTTILDECQKAGLANVSFQSKTAESPSTPGPVEHGR